MTDLSKSINRITLLLYSFSFYVFLFEFKLIKSIILISDKITVHIVVCFISLALTVSLIHFFYHFTNIFLLTQSFINKSNSANKLQISKDIFYFIHGFLGLMINFSRRILISIAKKTKIKKISDLIQKLKNPDYKLRKLFYHFKIPFILFLWLTKYLFIIFFFRSIYIFPLFTLGIFAFVRYSFPINIIGLILFSSLSIFFLLFFKKYISLINSDITFTTFKLSLSNIFQDIKDVYIKV